MKDINLVIWDLDGTKYKHHDHMQDIFDNTIVEVVNKVLRDNGADPLPHQEIKEQAHQSFLDNGLSWKFFSEKYALDPHETFKTYNEMMSLNIVDSAPSKNYKAQIQNTKKIGIEHIIYTHGSREWAKRVLKKIDLHEEFADDTIFDISHTQWALKHTSIDSGYQKLIALRPFEPKTTVMVEDTERGLIAAKDMGLTTILIDRDKAHKKAPSHVDYLYNCPEEFLHAVLKENQKSET